MDRMYRVIVLGGVALVAGCGARTGFREGSEPSDAAQADSLSTADTGDDDTGFPSELPVFEDTGIDTGSFPSEADPAFDTGVIDASALDTGFPHETK